MACKGRGLVRRSHESESSHKRSIMSTRGWNRFFCLIITRFPLECSHVYIIGYYVQRVFLKSPKYQIHRFAIFAVTRYICPDLIFYTNLRRKNWSDSWKNDQRLGLNDNELDYWSSERSYHIVFSTCLE